MGSDAAVAAAGDLIAALEKATLMAKQLPITAEPSHVRQIYATLHSTHHRLTMFLGYHSTPYPQPSLFPTPSPQNSISSAVAGGGEENDSDETMQVADDENDAELKRRIDGVEGRMKDFFIQNKRLKISHSASAGAAAEQRRSSENEAVRGGYGADFDPEGTKLRALDLIYQFRS